MYSNGILLYIHSIKSFLRYFICGLIDSCPARIDDVYFKLMKIELKNTDNRKEGGQINHHYALGKINIGKTCFNLCIFKVFIML